MLKKKKVKKNIIRKFLGNYFNKFEVEESLSSRKSKSHKKDTLLP